MLQIYWISLAGALSEVDQMFSDSSYSSNQIARVTITLREMTCLGHPLLYTNDVN